MQAFRKGMEYLVDEMDGKMLVYAAISPSLATGRYAHIRRIACDAFADINATEYTLNSTTYGWWQSKLYNYIDGDHVVFETQSAGENRARLTSAIINGTIITGDDFSKLGAWTTRAIELLQNRALLAVVADGKSFRPVSESAGQQAAEIFEKTSGNDYYLAIVNYGANEKSYSLDVGTLNWNQTENAINLFNSSQYKVQHGAIRVTVGGKDAVLLKFSAQAITAIYPEVNDTVDIFPNPGSNEVIIKSERVIRSLQVVNSNGKSIVLMNRIDSNQYALDISGYATGMYFVKIKERNGAMKTFRIVKK
jgi:alpha-galactosidase